MQCECSLYPALEAFPVPKGRLRGAFCEDSHKPAACASGQYRLSTTKAMESPEPALQGEEWPGQHGPLVSKCDPRGQKCMPTVNTTAWLMKSYVPLAVCPPADGLGLNGGVLPVTVWSGPYPNW